MADQQKSPEPQNQTPAQPVAEQKPTGPTNPPIPQVNQQQNQNPPPPQPQPEPEIKTNDSSQAPLIQQPHLVNASDQPKKRFRFPGKSFIIAILAIGVTITAGIGLALILSNILKKPESTPTPPKSTPQTIIQPTQVPLQPSPTVEIQQQDAPNSSFDTLLDSSSENVSTPSSKATQSANPAPTEFQ